MITGNKLQSMLRDARRTVEDEHAAISKSILEIDRSMEKLNARQTAMWKQFASIQAAEGTIVSDKLSKLRADRAAAIEKAHRTIEISTKEIADAAANLDELSKRKKAAEEAISAKYREVEEASSKDEAVVSSKSKLSTLDEDIAAAKKRLADAQADVEKKRPGYDDELFIYLEQKKYGTPDYRAIPLISTLDRLLALAAGYDRAKQDFDLLTGLPDWVDAKIGELTANREAEFARFKEAMAKYEQGADQLLKSKQDIEHEISVAVASQDAAEINKKNAMSFLEDVAHGNDSIQTKIVNECISLVKQEKRDALARLAERSKSKADDEALQEIDRINADFRKAKAERSKLQSKLTDVSNRLENIEAVERKFRREDWFDSDHKFRDGSYDVTGLMTGAVLADVFLRSAESGHIDPPRDYSSPSPSSNWSSGSGSSSTGWSGSGNRSNDDDSRGGFGGGNGWSTGGGFGGNDSFSSGDGF